MENKPGTLINLPSAIIIAGTMIALALIFIMKPAQTVPPVSNTTNEEGRSINLKPITSSDHIFGNPNAPIKIVEYSDPSCSYCKAFNETMLEIMEKYGPEGKVAWIYRSFPLDTPDANGSILHPNAGNESRALECAASLGGNEKFWQYEKELYSAKTSSTGLDQKQLPLIAKSLNINTVDFNECLSSKEAKDKVSADTSSGIKAGVSATPTSFFVLDNSINSTAIDYITNSLIQYRIPSDLLYVSKDKKTILMGGAMPKSMVIGIIESLLK